MITHYSARRYLADNNTGALQLYIDQMERMCREQLTILDRALYRSQHNFVNPRLCQKCSRKPFADDVEHRSKARKNHK